MLIIRFYNICQKYVAETEPFKNGQINKQLHSAHEVVSSHTDIAGYTIFERVGDTWLPYRPFNGRTTYTKRPALSVSL